MYKVQKIPRKTLITTDEVIDMAAIDQQPTDYKQLLQSIQLAEERFIKPALCSDLYYAIRDQMNVIVNDANKSALQTHFTNALNNGEIVNAIELVTDQTYIDLWYEHLWKLTAECVVYQASLTNYSRFTSSGEMQNNPASITNEGRGAVSVDLRTMQWKLKKILEDRIDPLIATMQLWIYEKRNGYPLHNCMGWYNETGVSVKRKTAWIHGIYKNDLKSCY
jgi:hypothetical protein